MTPPNTFRAINNPNPGPANPFNWLTHLDRQLVSPMELLQVSGFKPHELTQQFVFGLAGTPYQHLVPWFDGDPSLTAGNSHRLWRIFEFLETGDRASGVAPSGRIPGKVNINTIWDIEVFQAICAALAPGSTPNPNYFDTDTISNTTSGIFSGTNGLLKLRSPGLAAGGDLALHAPVNSNIASTLYDKPFVGMASGYTTAPDTQYSMGTDINNTF